MRISNRAKRLQWSPIRKLIPYADKAKSEGVRVYHLNIGQPDIKTPPEVLLALKEFKTNVISYGPSQGIPELREAISNYLGKYGLDVEPDEVVITNGGSEALLFTFSIVADDEDEIIVPEPFYTNYNGIAQILGVNLVPITTKAEEGFHLPPIEEFERAFSKKTRAVLLCSPNNPTGTILSEEEMKKVIDFIVKKGIFLITDEVYREFTFDGRKHVSALKFKEALDQIIVVDSVSKRFSMCGARIGSIYAKNREIITEGIKFAQARLCPPTVEQHLAIAAYGLPMEYFDGVKREYQRRRDVVWNALKGKEGIVLQKPEGAFYTVVKLPVNDSEEFSKWLLTDYRSKGETVMVAPAGGFYATPGRGKNEVRIAYVLEAEKLKRAMNMLLEALEIYPGRTS